MTAFTRPDGPLVLAAQKRPERDAYRLRLKSPSTSNSFCTDALRARLNIQAGALFCMLHKAIWQPQNLTLLPASLPACLASVPWQSVTHVRDCRQLCVLFVHK